MIPTAIVAGLMLGVWIRWWAVPIVALGWAVAIAVADPSGALGGALLGAVNGAVGVVLALALRQALRPRRNQPGHRR